MANPLKLLKLKVTGFQFIQEIPIDAPPKKVWASILKVGKWFGYSRGSDRVGGSRPSKHGPWAGDGSRNGEGWDQRAQRDRDADRAAKTNFCLSGPIGLTHLPVNNVFIFELQPKNGGKRSTLLRARTAYLRLRRCRSVKKLIFGGWKHVFATLKKPRGKTINPWLESNSTFARSHFMSTTVDIGKKLVELCKAGKNVEAIEKLYSPKIVSIEAGGGSKEMPARMEGIDAIKGKNEWWVKNHEVHSAEAKGPFPNGDRFAVYFKYDVTPKSGPDEAASDF